MGNHQQSFHLAQIVARRVEWCTLSETPVEAAVSAAQFITLQATRLPPQFSAA